MQDDPPSPPTNPASQSPPVQWTQSNSTSSVRTLANMLKSFFGSGVLSLPSAFSQSGILLGLATLFVVAVLSEYCTRLLVSSKENLEKKYKIPSTTLTFEMIGHLCLGNFGYYVVTFFLIFTQVGFCCAYVVFIASNSKEVYSFFPEESGLMLVKDLSLAAWVMIWLPVIILLNWIKDLKTLAIISVVGEVTLGAGLFYLLAASYIEVSDDQIRGTVSLAIYSTFPVFFGTAVYAFEGIGVMIPFLNSMKYPESFKIVLFVNYVISFLGFSGFGVLVYMAFGSELAKVSTVTSVLPKSVYTDICRIVLSVALVCTHPIQMYPVFQILENKYKLDVVLNNLDDHPSVELKDIEEIPSIELKEIDQVSIDTPSPPFEESIPLAFLDLKKNAVRTFIVVFSSGLAILVPNFQNFIGLIGAIGCSTLAFSLPSIFYWQSSSDMPLNMIAICITILIFSLIGMITSTYLNFIALFGL